MCIRVSLALSKTKGDRRSEGNAADDGLIQGRDSHMQ